MNEKSKSVCMGFNFHNKWFLWGVLGREIATDLPSRASGTITIAKTIAKMGAAGSAAPILAIVFKMLSGSGRLLGLSTDFGTGGKDFREHFRL